MKKYIQFTKFKQFNPEKQRLKRFQCEVNIEDQPDAPWLSLPNEINDIILCYNSLESYYVVKLVCKRLNKLCDRRVEKCAFENTLARCDSQERQGILDWWHNNIKLRAYSFDDPSLIEEYLDYSMTAHKIYEFSLIDNTSGMIEKWYVERTQIHGIDVKPRRELESVASFDAVEILKRFIEVIEEKSSDWQLMTDQKFQRFIWCLLVAFEEYLNAFGSKHKKFSSMHLFPVFMSTISKYSPLVIRLLLAPTQFLGRKNFPLMQAMPYTILKGLLEHNKTYPMSLTSILTSYEISNAQALFYYTPLLLACYVCDSAMFNEISKHVPIIPTEAYLAAVVLSNGNAEDRSYFFDDLIQRKIDINAKLPSLLRSSKHSWIETALGLVYFDYDRNDRTILIEWLLYNGAKFSETEIRQINARNSRIAMLKNAMEIIQSGNRHNLFETVVQWQPKKSTKYVQAGTDAILTFLEDDNFSVKIKKTTYFGKWSVGNKSNHIVCTATKSETEVLLRGSYSFDDGPSVEKSDKVFEFFAYQTFDKLLMLFNQESLKPSMESMQNAWVEMENKPKSGFF